jgi:hypothetical protein
MSPAEQAAYRGASDSDISQLTDRRRNGLISNLGSRGLLSSGVGASSFTALQNWQDNQRASAEANMYQMGAQRAMSIWDQRLASSQFGVNQLGNIAGAQQKAFGQAGYNAGAKQPGTGGTPPIQQTFGVDNTAPTSLPANWGSSGPSGGFGTPSLFGTPSNVSMGSASPADLADTTNNTWPGMGDGGGFSAPAPGAFYGGYSPPSGYSDMLGGF